MNETCIAVTPYEAYATCGQLGQETADSHSDKAKEYQRNRLIGFGLVALGGVGIVLSFVF